jgi:hypothetical protein
MADITRGTATIGQVATTRTVSEIHPANIDFLAISGDLAAEVMASGQLAYKHTDGLWYLSDANSGTAADKIAHGVVVNDVLAVNRPVTVMMLGTMGGYASLNIGALVYASNTEGEIADAAGTTYLPVGICISATEIFFFPILTAVLLAVYTLGIAAP